MSFPAAPVTVSTVFDRADLVELDGREGEYALRCPVGADTILSPKASGFHELRDMSYKGGPDETCRIAGSVVYFPNVAGARFAWPLIDGESS